MSDMVVYDGRQIPAPVIDGKRYVAMKPIVEGMGLEWNKQLELIKRDAVLSEGMTITGIPSDGGMQSMVCLPFDYLNGWLFKVPANRYKGERREKLIKYQKECYQALSGYFNKGGATPPLLVSISA